MEAVLTLLSRFGIFGIYFFIQQFSYICIATDIYRVTDLSPLPAHLYTVVFRVQFFVGCSLCVLSPAPTNLLIFVTWYFQVTILPQFFPNLIYKLLVQFIFLPFIFFFVLCIDRWSIRGRIFAHDGFWGDLGVCVLLRVGAQRTSVHRGFFVGRVCYPVRIVVIPHVVVRSTKFVVPFLLGLIAFFLDTPPEPFQCIHDNNTIAWEYLVHQSRLFIKLPSGYNVWVLMDWRDKHQAEKV